MNKDYVATIGLEIHAELKTRTKMFCDSRNDPEEKRPNVNVCPICMAHPGTLPVINQEAVKHVIRVGLALGGKIADFTEFDRKNYFYPDIPKGYQISQYKYPLVTGGSLNGVAITRVHLEEDTASLIHADKHQRISADGNPRPSASLVNFNRVGIPLMELVTEPVIKSAKEAVDFARELQLLLRYLKASEANMEKGEMRVEANISISKSDLKGGGTKDGPLGTKVEVKNLNSFKVVEKAIGYEIKRQIEALESGGKVAQETRGWDEGKQSTFSQREKESSHDYRYFPDPDLPKLKLSGIPELSRSMLEKEIPELPWVKRERLVREYKLKEETAEIFVSDLALADFFEEVAMGSSANFTKLAANYITSDLMALKNEGVAGKVPETVSFKKLIVMTEGSKLSSRGTKDILAIMYRDGGDPEEIATKRNLLQESSERKLKTVAEKIIANNPTVVGEYKSGKVTALQFLIGQGMKEAKGSANPKILKEVFIKLLE